VDVAERDPQYRRTLRFGPPGPGQLQGPELFEWDFLQTHLFRGLREDADFRRREPQDDTFGLDADDELADGYQGTSRVQEPEGYESDATEPQNSSEPGEYDPEPLMPMRKPRRYKPEPEPVGGYSPEAAACRARIQAMQDAADLNQGEVEVARREVQRRRREERDAALAGLQVEDAQRRVLRESVEERCTSAA
jgi:hypothetical protein